MHKMRLRYYVYIAAGVAFMITSLTDPEMRTVTSITAAFQSISALSRDVFAAFR